MGGELLGDQGFNEGDDRHKPADDQDICQDSGGPQETNGQESQGRSLVEVLAVTVNHYFPWFDEWLKRLTDIRNQDLIVYQRQTIIWAALIALITKRQARMNISYQMRERQVCENLKVLSGQEDLKNVPHGDTVEYLLARLKTEELEALQVKMISRLIRNRVLEAHRLLGKYYTIAIDGLYTHSFDYEHCEHCLKREDKVTGRTVWLHAKLQASLVTPTGLCLPIACEWIENEAKYDKQDCEIAAFKRLIVKLRSYYPRLEICLLLDALYGGQPIFDAIKEVNMQWIVVFKEGRWSTLYPWVMSIKEHCAKDNVIQEIEEQEIQERQKRSHQERLRKGWPKNKKRIRVTETTYTWMTGIEVPTYDGKDRSPFNVMTCKEVVDGFKTCDYVWLVSEGLNLSADTVKSLTQKGGRCRWKIENEGINTQKNGGYCLEHLYSRDEVSMKIWCALIDIAHLISQLIEQGSLIAIKTYGSIRNMARVMFEHFRYHVFRKPPNPPRIQIRLGFNTS
jgi:hypothetical protein